ncbi:MAG: hypothetical protein AB7L09_03185 [Nitrospira sp.]
MAKKPRDAVPFGILDALSVAHLPDNHLVAAVASYLLADGHGLPEAVELAQSAAELLAITEDRASSLSSMIADEMQRQVQIKFRRLSQRLWDVRQSKMGSELDWSTRINRLGKSVYGPPEIWQPIVAPSQKVREPLFNWYRRIDGVRLAGFDAYAGDGAVSGFVYREKGAAKFALLPNRTANVHELLVCLGLHPRLIGGDVKVDWDRRSFLVNRTDRLPWIV